MRSKLLVVFAACVVAGATAAIEQVLDPEPVIAHPGGLDSMGCHNDRQSGGYHCHPGPLAGQSFASRAEARQALAEVGGGAAVPSAPRQPRPFQPSPPAAVPYDRDLYTPGGRWSDEDRDCQNTRQEVLIAESLTPVTLNDGGCSVTAGRWFDPYTGQTFDDPSRLDIDHFIPLAEVHRSGGDSWTAERRRAYANDLDHTDTLIAVSASANRSKGDKDPALWMPPNEAYRCKYLRQWVVVKARWGLSMDDAEAAAVRQVLAGCP